MKQQYAIKEFDVEHMAKAMGKSLSISTKQSVEVCKFLKGRKVERAKTILKEVMAQKQAVPYTRYNRSMGHKKGNMSVGRYPTKTAKEILAIIESAEANAQFKGMSAANLVITHICAQKSSNQWHYGRQRRTKQKSTHIEVVIEEKAEKQKAKEKKETPKAEKTPTKEIKTEAEKKSKPVEEKTADKKLKDQKEKDKSAQEENKK